MKIFQINKITDELVQAFTELIPQLAPNAVIPTKTDLIQIVNSENIVLIAAEADGIVGLLTLVINKIPTGNKLWIEDVVVDSKMRGKGLGKQLTKYAIDYARENGYNQINLTSTPDRIAANQLYQNLGFAKRDTNVYRIILNS